MTSLPQVARALQAVLTTVPTAQARASGFCQRRSKLSAAAFVQATVLGWLGDPRGGLQRVRQQAAVSGVAISAQGVAQRFTPAAATLLGEVLSAAVTQVISADPVAAGLLAQFPAVVLLDSTTVALPDGLATVWAGCGGRVPQGSQSALKLTVALDLCRGTLTGPLLSDGRAQDKMTPLQQAPLPAGALRITDLGFWSTGVWQEMTQQNVYFLSRLHWQTAIFTPDGARLDLVDWLSAQRRQRLDRAVRLGITAQVEMRLLAVRVPRRVAAERRARISAAAQRAGRPPSAQKLALAAWTLLVTNAPAARLSLRAALVLARARWQIELLFKLWKSGGALAVWRSADPQRILCEVYAKLIALVIQHWLLLIGCWDDEDRSLPQAAQTVRDYALGLGLALPSPRALVYLLQALCASLAASGRINRRRGRPSLFQLLADPALERLA